MNLMHWIVTYGCKLGLDVMCRIDAKELSKVPRTGPLLAFTNHTGMVEAPLLYTQLQPRKKLTAIAKVETWDNWFLNWVFTLWDIIPIRRAVKENCCAHTAALPCLACTAAHRYKP